MTNNRKIQLLPYAIAIISVALALGLTLLLLPWLYPTITPLFFIAVMISAWYGGLGAGLLATVLSTLAIDYFFTTSSSFLHIANFGTIVRLGMFLTAAGSISLLNQSRRSALKNTKATLQTLQAAIEREQAAKEQLETVLSSLNDGFFVLDRNWRYIYVNERLCELAGKQREELLGYNNWELFPDAIDTEVYVQFQRAMSEQRFVEFEDLYLPWNRWFQYRVYPSKQGITVFAAEITKRKQAELMLVEQKRLLELMRLIIESAKDYAIFTLDLKGVITSWNPGAERLLGYTETEALGCSGQILFTPEDNEKGRADYEMQTALTQGRVENERWHIRKDGSRFWASGLMMPLMNEGNRPQGFVSIMQDKTAQRQASERLQLLYETTRDLLLTEQPLELMDSLFSKLSAQLELHYFYNFIVEEKNGQLMLHLRNYHGISKETAQEIEWIGFGEHLCGLVAQAQQQIVLNQAQLATYSHSQALCSKYITAYAGQPLIVQGKLLGTLAFASCTRTCFTPEEAELLQSTCDQIAIALERANLITSLQQQAEQLRQANRIKDEFLAVLSHELRSPLNPILGWTKMLQSGRLDAAKTAQALATIERNAKLQTELIDDLLDVSRILQGKLSLNICPVDLVPVIESAIETVSLAADAKAIEIHTVFAHEVGQVSGDPNRLQQVVWNLVSNGVKFTPNGGRVEVRLDCDDSYAQITVTDTGKGIKPEFLPYVFDYFRQEDGATTRKFGGLGLGLAIVRHLVELHGGTVEADSLGEGQGATFTVRLPLLETPKWQATSQERLPSISTTNQILFGIRILVVDDELDMRDVISFLLEQAGAEVTAVATANEALTVLAQLQPDILVSDIGMPEMDGYILLRQVRALPPEQGGQVRAIALTAYAGEIDQEQALAAGFQLHLTKPIEPAHLIKAITTLIGKSKNE